MSERAVRVNGATISNHTHETVRIVGEVRDIESDPYTIKSTDSVTIAVHPNNSGLDPERFMSKWVEVTGRVQDDKSILEDFSVPMADINPKAWDQMAELIDKHRDIFF